MLVRQPWSRCHAGIKSKGTEEGTCALCTLRCARTATAAPYPKRRLPSRTGWGFWGSRLGSGRSWVPQAPITRGLGTTLAVLLQQGEMQVRSVKTCKKNIKLYRLFEKVCAGAPKSGWCSFLLVLCFTLRRRERVQMQPRPPHCTSAADEQRFSYNIKKEHENKHPKSSCDLKYHHHPQSLLICLCLPNNVHKFFPREIKSGVFLWFSPPEGVLHKSPRYPPIQPKVQRSPPKALTARWLLWKRDWTEKKEGENLCQKGAQVIF